MPLFASPVLDSPALATRLRGLHTALLRGADPLERDELLSGTIAALVRLAARRPPEPPATARAATATCLAAKARELIHDCYTSRSTPTTSRPGPAPAGTPSIGPSARPTGWRPATISASCACVPLAACSPGGAAARVASEVGFTDQAHLTRWFTRSYGVTPAQYRMDRTVVAFSDLIGCDG
ncbi:helix-turn-helix domain-containing protein [Nonomuraea aurantiaca]|uniref:helix-turn-helix domain-containing protein n=1 Tax=Nonomuraea aurantiaca TaxID=2878562 RepID=UPI001CDA0765|nr:AraC family transcriptional regulator [Nonomuraea aurantiaca]MCA2229875.1 AraC family transcriptional regulator [Nonomuraea aurantiaca]